MCSNVVMENGVHSIREQQKVRLLQLNEQLYMYMYVAEL